MDVEERVSLFRDMIGCCHTLYLWSYDSGYHLISSNCPEQSTVDTLFLMSQRKEDLDRQVTANTTPIILTNEMGLMWVMAPRFNGKELLRLYVLGPFFVDDIPRKTLEYQMRGSGMSTSLQKSFTEFLYKLPIISLNRIFEYAVMLHFSITGERISVSDLRYFESQGKPVAKFKQTEKMDAHGTYESEQEMLRLVREGDLNYQTHMNKISVTGRLGKLSNGDSLRQMKNTVLVCITLFSRAAIEGGLSPEISYTLTDRYFQSVEACQSITDLVDISHTMQEDFIQRVHRCRTSHLSQPVQSCCAFISLHLEEPISLAQLALQTGYTEYYLSKKFKREVGQTPSEYIRSQRLERAAYLLRTTQSDVQDISAQLQFASQSYFSVHFRKAYGVSPTEYRQQR